MIFNHERINNNLNLTRFGEGNKLVNIYSYNTLVAIIIKGSHYVSSANHDSITRRHINITKPIGAHTRYVSQTQLSYLAAQEVANVLLVNFDTQLL